MKYTLTYSPEFAAGMQNILGNTKVVLASNSPRRAEILGMLGVKFSKIVPDVDENIECNCTPAEYACRLALTKVQAIDSDSDSLIVSADTIVVRDNNIINKPADNAEAEAMLKELSGVWHSVITSVAIRFDKSDFIRHGYCESKVRFFDLSEEVIRGYVAGGEPFGKAGAYAIQGQGGDLVAEFEGELDNIIGFPARLFYDLVSELKREV